MKDEDWNPGYWKVNKDTLGETWVNYDKNWFCNENKIIHNSEKEKNNCKFCSNE